MASETGKEARQDSPSRRWQDVEIDECGEPLVPVAPKDGIVVRPIYAARGYAVAPAAVFLRTSVVQRLHQAAGSLSDELCLLVWDGWRPLDLQRQLYDEYRAQLVESSGLTGDELDALVHRFVSEPSSEIAHPSPHLTGGAVDLTLCHADGIPLDMGGEFDELTERSSMSFYDERVGSSDEYAARRHLLHDAMVGAGFTNFASEWWHFDYGNQFWAHEKGEIAIYGRTHPVESVSRNA